MTACFTGTLVGGRRLMPGPSFSVPKERGSGGDEREDGRKPVTPCASVRVMHWSFEPSLLARSQSPMVAYTHLTLLKVWRQN